MPELGLGVQNVLRGAVDPKYPFSFAETPSGLLLLANGIDPMLKWDGLAAFADTVGITPPATALELGGIGPGYITGRLVAFVRFYDSIGNVSDLSPLSNVMNAGLDGLIAGITYSPIGVVSVYSPAHGLATGNTVIIDSVAGPPGVNGTWVITVVDVDHFVIDGLVVATGSYLGGGNWTMGVNTVVYGAVPLPTDTKVVGRQILRNLSGNLDTLYVDIDTTDLTSTAFSSQSLDRELMASTPVPMFYRFAAPPAEDGELPYANRNGLPPNHKCIIEPHKGRVFAAVDSVYTAGMAVTEFGSTVVQGVCTNWRSTFVGRLFYANNATNSYQIAAVNEANQWLTLATPFVDAPTPYCTYSIQPDPAEARLIYYSEPELPESWPAWNAIAIPEDEDDIVGAHSDGQYLYLIERRHTYRYTFQADPSDGMVFLVAHRGALSNRTYAVTDVGIISMDEIGVHIFDSDEGKSKTISMPIQNVFQGDDTSDIQVDWTQNQTLWHCAHEPVRDTVRFFVGMQGYQNLQHAIAYNYRTERWWIEQYPIPISSSANVTFGSRRCIGGMDARRIICMAEGSYDGVAGASTLRGTAVESDATTLTDSAAVFEDCEGAPVTIIAGTGAGQQRIIAGNTSTVLTVVQPWYPPLDQTSVYQIGGIQWLWRSGWMRYVDEEDDNPRDVEVIFKPTVNPAFANLNLYYDHSLTPRVWSRTITQDGVQTTDGSPIINVDFTQTLGWARQRISGHGSAYSFADRFVSFEMGGVQAGEPIRISQVVISGVEPS